MAPRVTSYSAPIRRSRTLRAWRTTKIPARQARPITAPSPKITTPITQYALMPRPAAQPPLADEVLAVIAPPKAVAALGLALMRTALLALVFLVMVRL